MSVIQQLEQKSHFTETEATIADFVLAHAEDIPSMGIAELADETFSSNAAIVRLCRKLGLSGYRDFRVAFATDYEKIRRVQQGEDVDQPFIEQDSPAAIMRSIANISQSAIEECYATISAGRINNAAKMLGGARRIFVYAAGETLINASQFCNLMLKIGRPTVFPARFLESLPITATATSQDVALVVSYTGSILAGMERETQMLRRKRVPIVVVSSLKECPEANLLITIPNREHSVGKVAGFYSQSCVSYVLNCLYANVYALDMERNRAYKDKSDAYAYTGDRLERRFGGSEQKR